VLGQQLKGVVVRLSISSYHSAHGGTISFLTAFADTTDRGHWSSIYQCHN